MQIDRRKLTYPPPAVAGLKKPFLGVVACRTGLQKWDIDDVEYLWVATVFVLTFGERHLLVVASTHGPHPFTCFLSIDPLPAADTPFVLFPGVRQTDNALELRHRCIPFFLLPAIYVAAQIINRNSLSSMRLYSGPRPDNCSLSLRIIVTPSPRRSITFVRPRPSGAGHQRFIK